VNERIEKLALDAGLLNYIDCETPTRYFIDGYADLEEVEKFAELIVLECVELCRKQFVGVVGTYPGAHNNAVKLCVGSIREQFGVAE
jgi:hypothetical protein